MPRRPIGVFNQLRYHRLWLVYSTGCVHTTPDIWETFIFLSVWGGSATRIRSKTEILENSGRSEYSLKRRFPFTCGWQWHIRVVSDSASWGRSHCCHIYTMEICFLFFLTKLSQQWRWIFFTASRANKCRSNNSWMGGALKIKSPTLHVFDTIITSSMAAIQ